MNRSRYQLDDPITRCARRDYTAFRADMTVHEAIESIRRSGLGEKVIYFYVVNDAEQLVGVLPTRRLLMALPEKRIGDIMVSRVISIPSTATVMEACELFAMYKHLAYPVVDEQNKVIGIVDVSLFTEEMFNVAETERTDDIFDAIGFRISQMRDGETPKQAASLPCCSVSRRGGRAVMSAIAPPGPPRPRGS